MDLTPSLIRWVSEMAKNSPSMGTCSIVKWLRSGWTQAEQKAVWGQQNRVECPLTVAGWLNLFSELLVNMVHSWDNSHKVRHFSGKKLSSIFKNLKDWKVKKEYYGYICVW